MNWLSHCYCWNVYFMSVIVHSAAPQTRQCLIMQSGNLRRGLRNLFCPQTQSTSSLQWTAVSRGHRVFAFPLSVTSHSWHAKNKVAQCVWAEVTAGMQIKQDGGSEQHLCMLTDSNEQREQRADWIKPVVSHILFVWGSFVYRKLFSQIPGLYLPVSLRVSSYLSERYQAGCCACFCWWDIWLVCTVCVRVYIPSLCVSTGNTTERKTVQVLGSECGAAPCWSTEASL